MSFRNLLNELDSIINDPDLNPDSEYVQDARKQRDELIRNHPDEWEDEQERRELEREARAELYETPEEWRYNRGLDPDNPYDDD